MKRTRREFIGISAGVAAALLAACGGTATPAATTGTSSNPSPAASSVAGSAASTSGASSAASPSSSAGAGGSASSAAGSAAPSSSPASASAAAASGAAPTGSVVIGEQSASDKVYDPGIIQGPLQAQWFWAAFDPLTWIDVNGKLNPGLATSWKNVDPTTWEFTLGDYKFQNGRPVDAQDVVDSFARYMDPAQKLKALITFTAIDKVTKVDSKTVRVASKKPEPTVPDMMAVPVVMPMKEFAANPDAFFKQPFGSGAYKVTSPDLTTSLKFTAMGPGWVTPQGAPHVKDIEVRFIADNAARAAALAAGDVDILQSVPPNEVEGLRKANLKVIPVPAAGTSHFLLAPNQAPTNDVRVRQAINYGVDKNAIIKGIMGGFVAPDSQLLDKSALGFNPQVQPYPYDPAKAKQLLAQAGFPNGLTLPMILIDAPVFPKDAGEAVAQQLAQIGVKTNITVQELAVWSTSNFAGPEKRPGLWAEITGWGPSYEAGDGWKYFSSDYPTDKGRRWVDETFDKMYQAAKATVDRDKRGQLYQQAGQYLHDQAPVLFMWIQAGVTVIKPTIQFQPSLSAAMYNAISKTA